MFGGQLPLEVSIAPDANQGSPIAVELLLVYRKPLLDELLEIDLGARDWFERREQFARDHPGQFVSRYWEWVPGQAVERQTLSYSPGVKGGLIFADFLGPGKHRAVIDPRQPLRLALDRTGFRVEPLE